MANEMKLLTFHTREELFSAAAELITRSLKPDSKVLLSGGSTPAPVYRLLAKKASGWKGIQWGLVDERFVSTDDVHSNEKMIREALGGEANISGMVLNDTDYHENLKAVNKSYQLFINHTDISILGMGQDGHTASVFPGDPSSELLMNEPRVGIFNTTAPGFPTKRITCSPEMLIKSELILILIMGKDKKEVLLDQTLELPIHKILSSRTDSIVYYAD
jgi:6-phosphogluconolactonase